MDPPDSGLRKLTTRPSSRSTTLGLREPPNAQNQGRAGSGSQLSLPGSYTAPSQTASGQALHEYSMEEVSKHCSEASAWMVFDGCVYDVTEFVHRHPGGVRSMMPYLGKDASEAFYRVTGHMFHQTDVLQQQLQIGRIKGYSGPTRQTRQADFEAKKKLRVGGGPKTFRIDFATKQVFMNLDTTGSVYHEQPLRAVTERLVALYAGKKQYGDISLVCVWVLDPALFFCQTSTAHLPLCNKLDSGSLRSCSTCGPKRLGYNVTKGTSVHVRLSSVGQCICHSRYFTAIHIGNTPLYVDTASQTIPSFVPQVLEFYIHNHSVVEDMSKVRTDVNQRNMAVGSKFQFMQMSNSTSNFKFQQLVTGGFMALTMFIQGSGIAAVTSIIDRIIGKYTTPLKIHLVWCIASIDALLAVYRDSVVTIEEYTMNLLRHLQYKNAACKLEISLFCSKDLFTGSKEYAVDATSVLLHVHKDKISTDNMTNLVPLQAIKDRSSNAQIWNQVCNSSAVTVTEVRIIDSTHKLALLKLVGECEVAIQLEAQTDSSHYTILSVHKYNSTNSQTRVEFHSSQSSLNSIVLLLPITDRISIPSFCTATLEPTLQIHHSEHTNSSSHAIMICGNNQFTSTIHGAYTRNLQNTVIIPL